MSRNYRSDSYLTEALHCLNRDTSDATFQQLLSGTKWGIIIETLVIDILHKKTTNWTSNQIVLVKRKYIFEVEPPPHLPIFVS